MATALSIYNKEPTSDNQTRSLSDTKIKARASLAEYLCTPDTIFSRFSEKHFMIQKALQTY